MLGQLSVSHPYEILVRFYYNKFWLARQRQTTQSLCRKRHDLACNKGKKKMRPFLHLLQIHCDPFQVAVVYIVVFVPSPPFHPKGVSSQSPSKNCSREGSSIVRHFLQTAWRPIFKKFDVQMPQECPLHFSRDVFKVQELAKLHYRVNLWTCGLCGNNQNWH